MQSRKNPINRIFLVLLMLLAFCLTATSCTTTNQSIGEDTDYIVVHSRSQKQSSGIFGINDNGDFTEELNKSKMQDLSFFAFDENYLLISGGRSNTNALFDLSQKGLFTELHWLNNADYSGVTAVELCGQSAFVVMNGNFSDDTYLNLVVEQNFDGNVIHQNVIELYCRDILIQEEKASIAGKHREKENGDFVWKASIIEYDIAGQKVLNQYFYDDYNCIWELVSADDVLFGIAEDKSEAKNTVCAIDTKTYQIITEIKIDDQLTGLTVYDNMVYAVGNQGIYQILPDMQYEKIAEIDCDNGSYVNWAYEYDGSYYIFVRKQQRELVNKDYHYGQLVQVELNTLETSSTPIKSNKKNTLDDILIFPTQMFDGE